MRPRLGSRASFHQSPPFNSFPVATLARACALELREQFFLSILSQLLREGADPWLGAFQLGLSILSQLLPASSMTASSGFTVSFNSFPVATFQFQNLACPRGVSPFNSFPVATSSPASHLDQQPAIFLSILSQLLQN